MLVKQVLLAVGYSVLVAGCTISNKAQSDEVLEILHNLDMAGFPADDIAVVGGVVYVGGDAIVSLAASREMRAPQEDDSQEQYRAVNLVGSSITKLCINGSILSGAFSAGLDLAIQNYNQLQLSFTAARTPSAGCSFTINVAIQAGPPGAVAGFPAGGLPFQTIIVNDQLAAFPVNTIAHVFTHEIGHTMGLRHSDFFNRSISCGIGGNEGAAGVGALVVPGTPNNATVGGSIMNSCFRDVESGHFTLDDITALQFLYPNFFVQCQTGFCFQACTAGGACDGFCSTDFIGNDRAFRCVCVGNGPPCS